MLLLHVLSQMLGRNLFLLEMTKIQLVRIAFWLELLLDTKTNDSNIIGQYTVQDMFRNILMATTPYHIIRYTLRAKTM